MSQGRLHEVQKGGLARFGRAGALRATPRTPRRRFLAALSSAGVLAASDAVMLLLGVALAQEADVASGLSGFERLALWVFAPLALVLVNVYGGHRPRLRPPPVGLTPQMLAAVSIAAAAVAALAFLAEAHSGAGPALV